MTLEEQAARELQQFRELVTTLVRKLDVALPEVEASMTLNMLRTGARYDGPKLGPEIEALRALLKLPKPAAEPHEFYEPGYCQRCKGSGYVRGGDGILTRLSKMAMSRVATFVLDEEAAHRWLRQRGLTPEESLKFLQELPRQVDRVGPCEWEVRLRDGSKGTRTGECDVDEDEDLSFFNIERRPSYWNKTEHLRTTNRYCMDVCPDCEGTGGRGLPKPDTSDP